jgi:hypothetical protein
VGGTFVDFTGFAGILRFFQMYPPANITTTVAFKLIENFFKKVLKSG